MLNAVIAIALVKHRVAKTRIWKCESKLQHLKVNQLILSEEWDSQMDNTKNSHHHGGTEMLLSIYSRAIKEKKK